MPSSGRWMALFAGGISPPAGGEFLSQRWERNQWPRPPSLAPSGQFTLRIAGDAADGLRLRFAPPRSIGPPPYPLCRYATSPPDRESRPRTPVTGVTPWSRQNPSGAQNLSDDLNPRRATGPWVCKNCSCCGSTTAPGFAEPTCLVQNMGYLIRPLRGHLPLKGKAFKWHPPAFPFRGRWHAKRDG